MTEIVETTTETTTVVVKTRRPAKELMATRTHASFGPAFISAVLGGVQKDHGKILLMATTMKIGRPSDLKRLSLETLRDRLAEAIMAAPEGTLPARGEFPTVKAEAEHKEPEKTTEPVAEPVAESVVEAAVEAVTAEAETA